MMRAFIFRLTPLLLLAAAALFAFPGEGEAQAHPYDEREIERPRIIGTKLVHEGFHVYWKDGRGDPTPNTNVVRYEMQYRLAEGKWIDHEPWRMVMTRVGEYPIWQPAKPDVPARNAYISGLERDRTYQFRVRSIGVADSTGWSDVATFGPIKAWGKRPDPPSNVKVIPGRGKLFLSWTPPTHTGGRQLIAYDIEVTPKDEDPIMYRASWPSTGHTITGLGWNKIYSVRVSVAYVPNNLDRTSGAPTGRKSPKVSATTLGIPSVTFADQRVVVTETDDDGFATVNVNIDPPLKSSARMWVTDGSPVFSHHGCIGGNTDTPTDAPIGEYGLPDFERIVTIPADTATHPIQVPVRGDNMPEVDKTLVLCIDPVVPGTFATPERRNAITILDDDGALPVYPSAPRSIRGRVVKQDDGHDITVRWRAPAQGSQPQCYKVLWGLRKDGWQVNPTKFGSADAQACAVYEQVDVKGKAFYQARMTRKSPGATDDDVYWFRVQGFISNNWLDYYHGLSPEGAGQLRRVPVEEADQAKWHKRTNKRPEEVPGRPRALKASVSGNDIIVRWKRPHAADGDRAAGYIVQLATAEDFRKPREERGIQKRLKAGNRSVTFDSVEKGVYYVVVYATNYAGLSHAVSTSIIKRS